MHNYTVCLSLLLQNMVGPGEVDEDLQPETTEECSKYGEVANCLVYEVKFPLV
jgi:splicing factor 45